MDQETNTDTNPGQANSLETPDNTPPDNTPVPSEAQPAAPPEPAITPPEEPKTSLFGRIFNKIKRVNIYLLIFLLVVVLAVIITYLAYQKSQQSSKQNSVKTSSQDINEDVLKQLRNTDVTLGEPKQILSVEANAVFTGTVLVRGDFEAAGQLKSQGRISGSDLNISGTGTFQTVQASKLQLSGDGQIQGGLNVQGNLSVSGSGSFGGTLTASKLNVQSLELAGNLSVSKHIISSGGTPSKSSGSALGGGGTSSVNGSDTAGTININTGSSPHAGCFITVSFAQKFSSTPHVVVTPVGSSAAGIKYYINRTSGGFSLCTTSSAPGGKNFAFDYIVIN